MVLVLKEIFKPGSDIELVLKGEELNLHLLNKISLDLDDLFLPYIFDISIYHRINSSDLTEHINRVGKVFYRKKEEAGLNPLRMQLG